MPRPTLTIAELAVDLRLASDPTVPPEEPLYSLLERIWAAASDTVEEYAGPDTGAETLNVAAVMVARYLYEFPESKNPFQDSGARAILSPWHVVRTVAV